MSGSTNNLPVTIGLEGLDQFQAQIRQAAAALTVPGEAARAVQAPLMSASEAFGVLETRAQRAGRTLNEVRGAIDLLGLDRLSTSVGAAASYVGNISDLFATAATSAGRLEGATGLLAGRFATVAGLAGLPVFLQSVGLGINAVNDVTRNAIPVGAEWQAVLDRINTSLETQKNRALEAARATRQLTLQQADTDIGQFAMRRGNAMGEAMNLDRAIARAEEDLRQARARAGDAGRNATLIQRAEEAFRNAQAEEERAQGSPILANRAALARASAEARLAEARAPEAEVARLSASLERLRTTRRQWLDEYENFDQEIARRQKARDMLRDSPVVDPGSVGGGKPGEGRGGRDTAAQDEARAQREYEQAEALARRTAEARLRESARADEELARADRRELDRRERENERATDNITRYLADGFASAYQQSAGGFRQLLRGLQQTALSTPIRIAAEAVIRPVATQAVSTLGLGGSGGASSLLGPLLQGGGLLNSATGGGLAESLGLSGLFAGSSGLTGGAVSNFLAQPLFGQAALSSATESALAGMGGAFGPAAPSSLGLGGASLGGALAGIGGGFAVGNFTAGLTARTPAQRTNGTIGAGVGSVAGFLIGGPVGGLIGGALGGAGGGLLGPSRRNVAFGVDIDVQDGRLAVGRGAQKWAAEELAQLTASARQEVDSINASLAALGLTVEGGRRMLGNEKEGFSVANLAFGLRSGDARVQGVLDRRGGGSIGDLLGTATEAKQFADYIDGLAKAVSEAADPVEAVRKAYEAQIETAKRLGFGLDEVTAAQERAVEAARAQRSAVAAGTIGGLADYARGLRLATDNSGNPLTRVSAARTDFEALASAALGGDYRALGRLQGSAESYRRLARDVYGTGQGFGAAENRIVSVLDQVGMLGAGALTDAVFAAETRDLKAVLVDELQRLRGEVAALRREQQQGSSNALLARAA